MRSKKERGRTENEMGSSSRIFVAMATDLLLPKWCRIWPLREEDNDYPKVKGFIMSSCMTVKITATHQCVTIGPREQAQLQIFKDNMEIVTKTRGETKVFLDWYRTSSKKHK